jgi:hypothetical protein
LLGYAVRQGRIPTAASQLCVDCSSPAAQYDHPRGYDQAHIYDVEAICARCRGRRVRARNAQAAAGTAQPVVTP